MRGQPFGTLLAGDPGLLRLAEAAVVDTHRRWHAREGRGWSEPAAYRWLRYEDPDPVLRLQEGLERLVGEGMEPDPELVGRATDAAKRLPGGEMIFGRRPGP